MSDDVRRRLEAAGSAPVPEPDPGFADRLEARLAAVAQDLAATVPDGAAPAPGVPRRPWLRRPVAALGIVAAAAVVVLVLASGIGRPGLERRTAPTLEGSINVEVALADGSVLEDPAGLVLPDGAVVTVGAGGSARIGDAQLAPGDVATVRDGRVEISRPPTGIVPSPRSSTTSPAPTAGGSVGSASPAPPTATPPPSRSPAPTGRTPATTATPATQAPAGASATPATTIRRPRLRARLLDGPRVAVTWTATERARSYVLVVTRSRSGPARDPVYPGSRELGEFGAPPESPLRYRVPDGVVEVRLMVVALRRDGSVLRRSNIVTITIPSPDAAGSGGEPSPIPSESAPASASPSATESTAP